MRIDEFSKHILKESHAASQELSSQTQEMQEIMNVSQEFQDIESICSGKLSPVPSQPAVVPSPRAVSSRDQSLRLFTWNLSGTQGNFFGNPLHVLCSVHHRHLVKEFFTLSIKLPQVGTACRRVQGSLLRKVKNKLEAQCQCRVLQEEHQP